MRVWTHLPLALFCLLPALAAPAVNAADCSGSGDAAGRSANPTITIPLPLCPQYADNPLMAADTLQIPNGRPIYALFVHGYSQNTTLNLFLCYNFAKRLMEDGAYVHFAWWNNLCAEYMARPLHDAASYPGRGGLFGIWDGAFEPDHKARPVDDYQFQADARLLLQTIREHNPSAMIIVVGHSMGGAAVARLGTDTNVVIDILAPLDPVDNRSRPWVIYGTSPYHNWTRYRIGHEDLDSWPPPNPERPRTFCTNVINLYHRYQKEYEFPMDHQYDVYFVHNAPPGGTTSQLFVSTCSTAGLDCSGACCGTDGHGEIVGYQGIVNLFESVPLALEAQSNWPTGRTDADICERRRLLMEMPHADYLDNWTHRPLNPDLCMVSEGLIDLYEDMNRPPFADAGGDRTVAHSTSGITLDGSASTDPDGDDLGYMWRGALWEASGRVATVPLGIGTHEVTLTVRDPSGHIDRDTFDLTVVEGTNLESPSVAAGIGAYPNPFVTSTQVVFEMEERERVSLQIFDLRGHLVRTLEKGTLDPGRYERPWNGRDEAGKAVSSGTYFVRIRAGGRTESSKVLLRK